VKKGRKEGYEGRKEERKADYQGKKVGRKEKRMKSYIRKEGRKDVYTPRRTEDYTE
jgi:hypothetical protein